MLDICFFYKPCKFCKNWEKLHGCKFGAHRSGDPDRWRIFWKQMGTLGTGIKDVLLKCPLCHKKVKILWPKDSYSETELKLDRDYWCPDCVKSLHG